MKKKIGIVTTWFERGASYVSLQFKQIWEKENEVYIYVRGGEKVEKSIDLWLKGNITYGKRYDYSNLDYINRKHFKKWIQSNNLDIVFFNEQHLWSPILICHELKVKTGAYIDYYTNETVPLFEIYDFLICNTKRHYSLFSWHKNVFYVPWGTNTSLFKPNPDRLNLSKSLTFFHSSGMNPYRKGCDFVLKAFYKIKDKNVKLIIHTQVNLQRFFPDLKNIIDELLTNKKLEIIHKTVSAPGLYCLGDIYVYPSRLEGIGLTIAEASSSGLPVITTDVPPMNEFINDGINGKLVSIKSTKKRRDNYYWKETEVDVDDLKSKMLFFLDHQERLHHFKKDAREYSLVNFCWSKNSESLNKIIRYVCNTKFEDKNEAVVKVKNYENSRPLKFYLANTTIYSKLKLFIKRFIKSK